MTRLDERQSRLVDYILTSRNNVFLTGRAGTGKTTLTRALMDALGSRAAILAPTGVAAVNAGGQTLHSFFSLPPRMVTPADIKKLRNARAVRALKTLIIDEISMVRSDLLWAIDASLRMNRQSSEPFGGVQMILVGDLAQLPPVVRNDEAGYLDMAHGGPFFFHAASFSDGEFTLIELETVYRQSDPEFIDILNALRDGQLERDQGRRLNECVTGRSGLEASQTHIVLTPTNQAAHNINAARLEALPGDAAVFKSRVEGQFEDKLAPTEDPLVLKPGARIMLIRNDPSGRWVNGTLATVHALSESEIEVKIGEDVWPVEPVSWERFRYAFDAGSQSLKKETLGAYHQYPLRLAWAMTIHKAQGLTLDNVYLDLPGRLFAHGQAYVALSRARSLSGLELSRPLTPRDIVFDDRVMEVKGAALPPPERLRSG